MQWPLANVLKPCRHVAVNREISSILESGQDKVEDKHWTQLNREIYTRPANNTTLFIHSEKEQLQRSYVSLTSRVDG